MITTKIKKIGLIGIGLFLLKFTFAQQIEERELRLEEAIEQTLHSNEQGKIANLEYLISQTEVDQIKSRYSPTIQANTMASINNMPLQAFGNRLQQGAIQESDFLPTSLNSPSSISNFQTQLVVYQPLLNLESKSAKEAAVAKTNAYKFRAIRTHSVLRHQVRQLYMQLKWMYEVKAVYAKAKQTVDALAIMVDDKIDAGYLQHVDLLSVEIRQADIDARIIETDAAVQTISDQLSFLMGRELNSKFKPIDLAFNAEVKMKFSDESPLTRSDIKATEHQVKANKYALDAALKSKMPNINAIGSLELNNNLKFSEAQYGYMVGVQVSWKIFDGNQNKNAVKKARIELEKAETQLSQVKSKSLLEFENVKRKISISRNNIEVALKAIAQSKESLRIKQDRFNEGMEQTTDLLVSETSLAEKELEHVQALYHLELAQAELEFILEKN